MNVYEKLSNEMLYKRITQQQNLIFRRIQNDKYYNGSVQHGKDLKRLNRMRAVQEQRAANLKLPF